MRACSNTSAMSSWSRAACRRPGNAIGINRSSFPRSDVVNHVSQKSRVKGQKYLAEGRVPVLVAALVTFWRAAPDARQESQSAVGRDLAKEAAAAHKLAE